LNDTKKNSKVIASPFLAFGYVFYLVIAFGVWSFVLTEYLRLGDSIQMRIVLISFSSVAALALLTVILLTPRAFAIIEISEKGIKRSLFAVFKKRELLWEEIVEIRAFWQVGVWLFASKSCLENINYNKLIKHKDAIQITFSAKALKAIRKYYTTPIINLSEEDEIKILDIKKPNEAEKSNEAPVQKPLREQLEEMRRNKMEEQ